MVVSFLLKVFSFISVTQNVAVWHFNEFQRAMSCCLPCSLKASSLTGTVRSLNRFNLILLITFCYYLSSLSSDHPQASLSLPKLIKSAYVEQLRTKQTACWLWNLVYRSYNLTFHLQFSKKVLEKMTFVPTEEKL